MNVNIGYVVILPFYDFHPKEVKKMLHTYKYVFKQPFRQDIFKQTYRNVMFTDYILTLAIFTVYTKV